jgi:pimeloyl-ACP methyl ester carboxylesterase
MSVLRILVLTALTVVVLLLLFQQFLIYHPRRYSADAFARYPFLIPLGYTTAQGRQQAYYSQQSVYPVQLPHRLWIVFPGNASRALDWVDFLNPPPDSRDGFLLIDYPGYGECEGSPSPVAIQASADGAFACLAQSLHSQPEILEKHINLLCQSIGCATGLNFAVGHPVDRIILLSPFTSLREMAQRMVGWPLCWLLLHNFDNRVRLRELAARQHPPKVMIFHGDADTTVPIAMGRQLASMFPGMISFREIPGAEHNTILFDAQSQIFAAMRE